MSIDFPKLAADLAARASELLPIWLPGGKRRGNEWVCGNLRGEPGASCSTNINTGAGADFATGQTWGDLVALYAAIHHLSQAEAAYELTPDDSAPTPRANGNGHHAPPQAVPAAAEHEAVPAPEDAALPNPPRSWGDIHGEWRYYLAGTGGPVFVVRRFDPPDQRKQFLPYTWRNGKWSTKSYPAPRPLYRLRELLARPDAPVLVVEGEKSVDAATPYLPDFAVTTWAGGSAVAKSADWRPLAGREVTIWPDNDEPGSKAAAALAPILLKLGCRVRVLRITDASQLSDGWDVANAIDEDWSTTRILEFIAANAVGVEAPNVGKPAEASGANVVDIEIRRGRKHDRVPPIEMPGSAPVHWQEMGLDCNSGGMPHPTLSNASLVFQRHPTMTGKLWFDTFRGQLRHTTKGEDLQWTDHDDLDATAWLQQSVQIPKIGLGIVRDAIIHAARRNSRNSVHTWLESLEWDGVERLSTWLHDCLGVPRSTYNDAIARNWPVAMVARAYKPGEKMDNMPVLEGRMGRGKSTFLEMLGSPWYASLPDEFGSKDFLQTIQGRWLIEVPDMTGFSKREHTHILAIITRRDDPYRATWGRHVQDHPRVSMFAATSETDDYLQDSRGIRRYWPVRCQTIDLEVLRAQREQIFAEALIRYREHATWHEVPETETTEEQRDRITQDPWQNRIAAFLTLRREVQIEEILSDSNCINMAKERQTRREVLRVAAILREIGWRKARPKDESGRTYAAWWPTDRLV